LLAELGGITRAFFPPMMKGLVAHELFDRKAMINAIYLKAHRTASNLQVKKIRVV